MRENRTYGSEGGEGHTLPDTYRDFSRFLLGPRLRGDEGFVYVRDFVTAAFSRNDDKGASGRIRT